MGLLHFELEFPAFDQSSFDSLSAQALGCLYSANGAVHTEPSFEGITIAVPKYYRPECHRPAPSWLSIWKSIYQALAPHAVSILMPTGFYDRHDLDVPRADQARRLAGEEKAAIERIASALTIAAYASHRAPTGIVRAWLLKIAREPALFWFKNLPPQVHWAIVSNYARDDEAPGTHLQDVLGRRRVHFEAKARRPTAVNLAKAARRALARLPQERGRPKNVANPILAELLTPVFQSFGGRVVRRQIPVDKPGGGTILVEDGPFHHFLKEVIGPLQAHLKQHGLPAVTIETVERIATEKFA